MSDRKSLVKNKNPNGPHGHGAPADKIINIAIMKRKLIKLQEHFSTENSIAIKKCSYSLFFKKLRVVENRDLRNPLLNARICRAPEQNSNVNNSENINNFENIS